MRITSDFLKNFIHPDLAAAKNSVYDPCHFICTQAMVSSESQDYGACAFSLNDFAIQFRTAKTTPTKVGQFVTVWRRNEKGLTQPYDLKDGIDFFIISTRTPTQFGQFIFPVEILLAQNIIANHGKGGKRGIRIYPPWEKILNRQAQKTQRWQIEYFLDLSNLKTIDLEHAKYLLRKKV